MKKLVYIAAAFAAILACSKESQAPQEPQDTNNDNTPEEVVDESKTVHELFVSLPDFTDAETKAIIDDATGSFSWTVGDKIAVVDDQNNVYPFVASEAAQSVRFTYVGAISGTLQTIYYPYTEEAPYYITEMPTNLDSETAALSSSNIRLTGSIVGNSATLYHNHAFVRLKFENVPSFAKKIQFYEASNATPTLVTLTGTGSVTAYLPVHGGTQAITASLIDANNNEIIKKYHDFGEENAFVNGSIKNMRALTVGHVFTFINEAEWLAPKVNIWNGGNDFGFKSIANDSNAEYPWKLNYLGNNKYYIVINDDVINGASHVFANDDYLGVWFGNDNSQGSETQCVYLNRDIEFTIPDGGGLRTDYRIYPHGTTSASKAYAEYHTNTYDIPTNVSFTISKGNNNGWGDWNALSFAWYAYYTGTENRYGEVWPGTVFSTPSNNSYTFTIPSEDLSGKELSFIINNNNNGKETKSVALDFNSVPLLTSVTINLWDDDSGDNNKTWASLSDQTYASEILEYPLGVFPGLSMTVSSSIDASNYISIPASYYGKTLTIRFLDNGNAQVGTDWVLTDINRDFDYGF